MFVRWRRRQHRRGGPEGGWTLSAMLIKSVRTPAGPRQVSVAYLGSIEEWDTCCVFSSGRFWDVALAALDGAGVRGRERARIEAALKEVVYQRPSDRQRRAIACLREERRRAGAAGE
jgi:hypothetical protein